MTIPAADDAHAVLQVEALLFDLDGTLIDSARATENAWSSWGEQMGLPGFRYHHHGVPARTIVAQYVEPARRAEGLELINALEAADVQGISAKPGAVRLLRSLPRGRWAIVTSGVRALATARIAAAGLAEPEVMITADGVDKGKPDPEGFLAAASSLGVRADACLVLEDAAPGVRAGRAAGAITLGVSGTHEAAELGADFDVDTLEHVSVGRLPGGALEVRIRLLGRAAGAARDGGG
jgi:mannitol-1-/sugar-/sorbitol-6-phosphatase